MRLNKIILFFVSIILILGCSSSYDDTDIKNQVDDLDSRVTKLEALVNQMNANISSFLTTVDAIKSGDRIVSVTPLEDGSGFTVTFSKAGAITIYNGKDGTDGKDGQDGVTPVIGVKLDEDGNYYWTVNGEYLLDNNGGKIAATAHVSTPQIRVNEGNFEITYNNGVTWEVIGSAGQTGSFVFTSVVDGEDNVTFTLTDGTTIVIPKVQAFALVITNTSIGLSAGQTVEIPYTVKAFDEGTVVDGIADNGYKVEVESAASGVIKVTAPNPLVNGKAIIMAVNSKGTTSGKILTFEEGVLTMVADATAVSADGTSVTVLITTNLDYSIVIPDDAKSWISVVETKALRTDTITLNVTANTGAARTATIDIVDSSNTVRQSFTIEQAAGSGGSEDPSTGYGIDDWVYDDPISL